MSFVAQKQVTAPDIGVFNYSSPASITFNNQLYLFYNGRGNDGIWYAIYNESSWAGPLQCKARGASNMGVASNTSPCAVVFNNTIYLFFNGSGNNGTWCCTSTDGQSWTQVSQIVQSETFAAQSSPSAVVRQGLLYLFWCNSQNNGLRYMTFDGKNWTGATTVSAEGLGVAQYTSAATVDFLGSIYLFFNGSGGNGTWMTTFTNGAWTGAVSLAVLVQNMNFLPKTSPALILSDAGVELTLMWCGSGNNGVWYTSTADGSTWISPAISMQAIIGQQGLLPNSSPTGVVFNAIEYVFWAGYTNDGIWFTQGRTLDLDNPATIVDGYSAIINSYDFTITVTDQATVDFFSQRFPPGPSPLPGPDSSSSSSDKVAAKLQDENFADAIKALLGAGPTTVGIITAGVVILSLATLCAGYAVTFSVTKTGVRCSCRKPPRR